MRFLLLVLDLIVPLVAEVARDAEDRDGHKCSSSTTAYDRSRVVVRVWHIDTSLRTNSFTNCWDVAVRHVWGLQVAMFAASKALVSSEDAAHTNAEDQCSECHG